MAVVVPSTYPLLRGLDLEISRSLPIRATTAVDLAEGAQYAYAYAGRRMAAQLRRIPVTGVTSYVVVYKGRFDFAGNRDDRGLRLVARLSNVDLEVQVRDALDGSALATYTETTGGSVSVDTLISGWATLGSESVLVRVRAQRHTTGDAQIIYLGAWEGEHSAATLSALAS